MSAYMISGTLLLKKLHIFLPIYNEFMNLPSFHETYVGRKRALMYNLAVCFVRYNPQKDLCKFHVSYFM